MTAKTAKQKTKPKLTDKRQSERFKEAARKLEADETGKSFERAFSKIVPATKRPSKSA